MITMTTAQANLVRQHYIPGFALAPRPMRVGPNVFTSAKWALPESVLTDPIYASLWMELNTFTIVADSSIAASDWSGDPATLQGSTFDPSWPVGQTITCPPITSNTPPSAVP